MALTVLVLLNGLELKNQALVAALCVEAHLFSENNALNSFALLPYSVFTVSSTRVLFTFASAICPIAKTKPCS